MRFSHSTTFLAACDQRREKGMISITKDRSQMGLNPIHCHKLCVEQLNL